MRYCCVPHCTGRGGFLFPQEPTLRAKWIAAVRREGLIITTNTAVCSSHFRQEDFKTDTNIQGKEHSNDIVHLTGGGSAGQGTIHLLRLRDEWMNEYANLYSAI